jgi:hypothetical protein
MALTIIVSGLNTQEVSFIKDASSLFWGEGLVEIKEYELSDLNLVKDLRLQIKDTSLVGVFLADFSNVPALQSTRGILESESKFFEVKSTKDLVNYLNTNLGSSIEYKEETVSPNSDAVSTGNELKKSFEEDYYIQQINSYIRQLESKEGTIRNLESQLEEYKLQFSGTSFEEDFGIEIEPAEGNSSNEAELLKQVKYLQGEVDRLNGRLNESIDRANTQTGLVAVRGDKITELESRLKQTLGGISQEDLNGKLEELRAELESKFADERIKLESTYNSNLANKNYRITELESELAVAKSNTPNVEDIKYSYEQQISKLKRDLESEKRNVIDLNRELLKNGGGSTSSQYEDWDIQPVSSFFEIVTGDLLAGLSPLKNTEFVFAGSGDSLREAYIHSENLLKQAGGGIILDLSTESSLDYRFGIRRGHEVSPWFSDEPKNIKKYLSKTKHGNIYALGTFKGSFNELYLASADLRSYLQYLDSLGTKIIIFGGSISSFMGRKLCSSALPFASVQVVCRSLGTSVRSMFFNSKAILGGINATYLLMGKVDEMSKKVSSLAKREGYDWRFLDA